MGRPSKLTPELVRKAEQLLAAGNYTTTVCDFLGIDRSTWYKWLEKGRKANRGLYFDFFNTIKRAEAESEVRAVTGILKAGANQWQAFAWFLERKFPERWRRDRETPGEDGDRSEACSLAAILCESARLLARQTRSDDGASS